MGSCARHRSFGWLVFGVVLRDCGRELDTHYRTVQTWLEDEYSITTTREDVENLVSGDTVAVNRDGRYLRITFTENPADGTITVLNGDTGEPVTRDTTASGY